MSRSEGLYAVDIDQMGGFGEPERHGRHQALTAGEHAAILRGDLGEQRYGFIDRLRRMIAKRRRLHWLVSTLGLTYVFERDARFLAQSQKSTAEQAPNETTSLFLSRPAHGRRCRRPARPASTTPSLLAGGQSLMPMLNMRYVLPDHVIDLNRVDGLSYIRERDGAIEIGAMTRQRDIEFSDLVRERCPLMHEAIRQVGHRQTRNRGTLGGSLCHLDPSAELVSVAAALDAKVTVAGKNGTRSIDFASFPVAYMTPALELDELVTGASFPYWPAGHGYAFVEFARRHGDFAIVSAAVLIEEDSNGKVTRASVTLGGMGPAPVRAHEVETRADRRDDRGKAAARNLRDAAQARRHRGHPCAGFVPPAIGDGAAAPRAAQSARTASWKEHAHERYAKRSPSPSTARATRRPCRCG